MVQQINGNTWLWDSPPQSGDNSVNTRKIGISVQSKPSGSGDDAPLPTSIVSVTKRGKDGSHEIQKNAKRKNGGGSLLWNNDDYKDGSLFRPLESLYRHSL